ncbi:hypothetical protein RB213_016012 [Colletotrichum asianum]
MACRCATFFWSPPVRLFKLFLVNLRPSRPALRRLFPPRCAYRNTNGQVKQTDAQARRTGCPL